jgi:acetyl esterase
MNITIRTIAGIALILSTGVVQSRSGVVLAGESEQEHQYVYKTIGDRELQVDILYPDDWKPTDRRAAIVFFSGGAWRSGGTGQFAPQAGYFAKRGLVTVRAEYRDSTRDKAKPDTCLKDAVTAMRWVRESADKLGIDPRRIVSSGGSAGG